MRALLLVALLAAPALAGCIDDSLGSSDADAGAPTKEAAGARAGPAPKAADGAYRVNATGAAAGEEGATLTAHPLKLRTNPAKEPVTLTFEGQFEPTDCGFVAGDWQTHDLSEALEVSDVYLYNLTLTFENTNDAWGSIHLIYGIGASNSADDEDTARARGPVSISHSGQGYRVSDDAPAWAAVACWYGFLTKPIPYKLTATFSFAENAVPAETPVLVPVPAGATRLIVTAVPFEENGDLVSHFRVFDPKDRLVCECALGSDAEAATIRLTEPGDYVVLVDHTGGGFVSLATDVPATDPLIALDIKWTEVVLGTFDGSGATDATAQFDVPSTPLTLGAWYTTTADQVAGGGRNVHISIQNARGEVFRAKASAFVATAGGPLGFSTWRGLPLPGEWDWHSEHHKYAPGQHTATIRGEWCRCEVFAWYSTYARV